MKRRKGEKEKRGKGEKEVVETLHVRTLNVPPTHP
jgi:hypothetical protein